MSVFDDVRAQAAAIGLRLPPAIGDTEIGIVVRTATARITDMARRDWAARVLDEWADAASFSGARHWRSGPLPSGNNQCQYIDAEAQTNRVTHKDSADAARLAAAEAVWPTLPADVRAEIGERP